MSQLIVTLGDEADVEFLMRAILLFKGVESVEIYDSVDAKEVAEADESH